MVAATAKSTAVLNAVLFVCSAFGAPKGHHERCINAKPCGQHMYRYMEDADYSDEDTTEEDTGSTQF